MLLNLESRESESGEYVVCRTAFFHEAEGGSDVDKSTIISGTCAFFSGGERLVSDDVTNQNGAELLLDQVTGELFHNLVGSPVHPPKEVC